MPIFTLLGLLALFSGSVAIYLASPNQRWRSTPWPSRPARVSGFLLLLAGYLALLQALQPAAGTFVCVHWLIVLFIVFPYLGALRGTQRRTSR
jgi:uncharacterized membrane protein HdeD (DUF308 family)